MLLQNLLFFNAHQSQIMLLQNLLFFNAHQSQISEDIMLQRQVKNYVNANQSF
jgi:hypothetical protein